MNPVSALASGSSTSDSQTTKKSSTDKEMFLQLLVAQIKNQNPLSPTDGVQFLTQLAQFTEVEQLTAMRSDVAAVRANLEAPTGAATTQN